MDLSFIICTEPAIEKQSRFFARSVRKWVNGNPIYSFSPKGLEISEETKEDFKKLNVIHEKCEINTKYETYNANKPIVAAYAEKKNLSDIIVFADSDTIFLDYPDYLLEQNYDMAGTPEELINIGTANLKSGHEAEFWTNLYNFVDKIPTRMTKSVVDEVYSYEYYNSGLIGVKTKKGIFSYWEEIYKHLEENKIYPKSGNFFVEQASLAAAITVLADKVLILPKTYNYPISWYPNIIEPRKISKFEDVVSIHYHRFLGADWENDIKGHLFGINNQTEKFRWIIDNLKELYGQNLTSTG